MANLQKARQTVTTHTNLNLMRLRDTQPLTSEYISGNFHMVEDVAALEEATRYLSF